MPKVEVRSGVGSVPVFSDAISAVEVARAAEKPSGMDEAKSEDDDDACRRARGGETVSEGGGGGGGGERRRRGNSTCDFEGWGVGFSRSPKGAALECERKPRKI